MTTSLEILLDVDGVAANWLSHLLYMLNSKLTPDEITQWDLQKTLPPDEFHQAQRLLSQTPFWVHLPVMPGAIKGVHSLRQAGHYLHWVTSPWLDCPAWGYVRRDWLAINFDVHPHDVTITHRKDRVSGHVLIDDKPDNVRQWAERHYHIFGMAMLFDAPYNARAEADGLWRRATWDTIPDLVETLGEVF